jgi:hypothetical protein
MWQAWRRGDMSAGFWLGGQKGRLRRRWKDNIKMDLREIGIDGANWIQLAQYRVHWWAYVNRVMNLRVP